MTIIFAPPPLGKINYFLPIINGSYYALKSTGYVARNDARPVKIENPIRFDVYRDSNVNFAMHSWRFLNAIWARYVKTGNRPLLDEILSYMQDWQAHKSKVKNSRLIWYDMATGIRAIHIALLTYIIKTLSVQLSVEQQQLLHTLQHEHLEKLFNPSWISLNNHGLWQILGLRLLSWSLDDVDTEIVRLCDDKLNELLEFSFDEEGVHTENSPFYHRYVCNLVKFMHEDLFYRARGKIIQIHEKGDVIAAWLTDPKGNFYQIGDTEGKGLPFPPGFVGDNTHQIDGLPYMHRRFNGGYCIVRTAPTVALANSSALVFHGTNRSEIHNHADKLSFILFHRGIEIFTDAGKYIYENGVWSNYFVSDKAHNVIGFAESPITPKETSRQNTSLNDIHIENEEYILSGKTTLTNNSLEYSRRLFFKPNKYLTIIDTINNTTENQLEQRFHLGIGIKARITPTGVNLYHGAYKVARLKTSEPNAQILIESGQLNPINGWCSKKYGEKSKIDTIRIILPAETKYIESYIELLDKQTEMAKPGQSKNLAQWRMPVFVYADLDSALASKFAQDGIYQIEMENEQYLDIMIKNSDKFASSDTVVVGFNGAVSSRGIKKGPFFSGVSITDDLDTPCIFVSDPTLDLSQSLTLSWYAGNEKNPSLQAKIANLLNGIAKIHELRIILLGGSGAGFAILSIIQRLKQDSLALVWNPQTSIAKYFPHFVYRYLETAFPTILSSLSKQQPPAQRKTQPFFEKVMDKAGITHSLSNITEANQRNRIVYLQNRHDWHLEQHANTFLGRLGKWKRLAPAVFTNETKMTTVVVGDWGDDHAVPTKTVIHSLLKTCIDTHPNSLLVEKAQKLTAHFEDEIHFDWSLCHDHELILNISAQYNADTNTLRAQTAIANPQNDGYTYAFYLVVNGERKNARWYAPSDFALFDVSPDWKEGEIKVVAFVKDKIGRLTIENIKVIL